MENLKHLSEIFTETANSVKESELTLKLKDIVGSPALQCLAWTMLRGTKPKKLEDLEKWCCESFSEEEVELEVPSLNENLLENHVIKLCGDLDTIEKQLQNSGIKIVQCPAICALNLANNDLKINDVSDAYRVALLFAALRRNEYCVGLNMSSNPLGHVSGICFGSLLKHNTTLHTLSLSRVNLGDKGVSNLVKYVIFLCASLSLSLSLSLFVLTHSFPLFVLTQDTD